MLFNKKPTLYFQFLEKRVRYIAVDHATHTIIEKDDIIFETNIMKDGNITDASLIENRLKAFLTEKKWKNTKASLILPEDHVSLKEEKIPAQLEGEEIRDYLNLHINHSIRVPYKNTMFHYEILEKDDTNQLAIMMIYSEDTAKELESLLEKVSLKPIAADISYLALYRILASQDKVEPNDERHIIILQWNLEDIVISVFHKGIPRFSRRSRRGHGDETWKLSDDGNLTWTKDPEILEEIIQDKMNVLERFLEFYRYSVLLDGGGVSDIYLTGEMPYLDDIQERLEKRFYLNIHKMNIADDLESKYLLLYGVSLRSSKPSILKKKQEEHKKGVSSHV